MDAFLDPDDNELLNRISYAARDGHAITIFSLLNDKPRHVCNDLINRVITQEDGLKGTPLIVAAKYGHHFLVKMLLDKFDIDLEKEGTVKYEGFNVTEGVTALWCAAAFGHLNVVKCLVRHGANINHKSKATGTSPLRAACYEGRLDIVLYLINHNVDIHTTNINSNTCLMAAAFKGYYHIVKILLKHGADPNQVECNGSEGRRGTALHYAAELGHVKIVELLLEHGATFMKNANGMTPLIAAAERTRTEVVELLISTGNFTKEEIIDAYELLGASYANDNTYYCLNKAYKYLSKAMSLRYSDPNKIIRKKLGEPVAAYQNIRESETLEELERRKNNPNMLHMESLAIRERILGSHNTEVPHAIFYRGAVLADDAMFDRCVDLWLHALRLKQGTNIQIKKELLQFAQVFSQMLSNNIELQLTQVNNTLELFYVELAVSRKKLLTIRSKESAEEFMDILELNLTTTLYLVTILTKVLSSIDKDSNEEEIQRSHYLVFKLCALEMTLRDGQTLLHMAVNFETPVDDFYTNDVCKYPCEATTKLLIKCAANINAMDNERNTPLHIVVRNYRPFAEFMTINSIVVDLINAGAHIDIVNSDNQTPYDYAKGEITEMILQTQSKISLQCIAAKAVKTYNLPYVGSVPRSLEHFIELHGCGSEER